MSLRDRGVKAAKLSVGDGGLSANTVKRGGLMTKKYPAIGFPAVCSRVCPLTLFFGQADVDGYDANCRVAS